MIYTKISSFIVNRRNMRYYFFLGLIMFLLILSNVKAIPLNFTDAAPITLNYETTGIIQHISTYFDGNYWYIIYYDNVPELKIAKYTSDFSLRLDGWDTIASEAYTRGIEIGPNPGNSSELYVVGFTKSVGAQCQLGFGNISKADLSISLEYKNIDGGAACGRTSTGITGLDNQRIFLDKYSSGSNYMAHTWYDASGDDRIKLFPYYTNPSDGYIPFQPTQLVTSTANNRHPFIFQVYNTGYSDELWLISQSSYNGSWETYLQRYNWLETWSDPANWKGIYRITTVGDISQNASTSFYEPSEGMLYTIYKNGVDEQTYRIKKYDVISTIQTNSLILSDSQDFNLTYYDASLFEGTNYTNIINLYYGNSNYFLFYGVNDGAKTTLKVLRTASTPCTCGEWIPSSCASNGIRKQTRTCVPTFCQYQIQNVNDSSCINEFIGYENVTFWGGECTRTIARENIGLDFSEVAGCGAATCFATIPDNCTGQIQVEAVGWQTLDDGGGHMDWCSSGNHSVTTKTPTWGSSSSLTSWNCTTGWGNQVTKSYNNYTAGQEISASFTGCLDANCVATVMNMYDCVKQWTIHGNIKITCQILCDGYHYCSDDYTSAIKNADCSDTYSSCGSIGCDYSTGYCNGESPDSATTIPSGSGLGPSGNVFTWLINSASGVFPSVVLLVLSVGSAAGGMIIGTRQADDWRIGLGIGLLICAIFWKIGWLDAWILLLWGLTVAILLTYNVSKKIKGEG